MKPKPPAPFRCAMQVVPERIARMDELELNELMGDLLRAQAYRCKSPISELRVNTQDKAPDGGCDGWTGAPAIADEWLGKAPTCWQFKSGQAGIPSAIGGEVTKPKPEATLAAGRRFVLVANRSTNGRTGEDDRRNVLCKDAQAAGLPIEHIHVIGSERLATWCNQHPAIAAKWAGMPSGLWALPAWAADQQHETTWQGSEETSERIKQARSELAFETADILHLHIHGQPGVGKTRFALEMCRNADWASHVVYVRQASDVRLAELLDGAAQEPDVLLVVVVDEVQAEHLRPLRDSIGRGSGRIRLITIGHCRSPEASSRIATFEVTRLASSSMATMLRGAYPALPAEHVEFVAQFADGYVRLARLAADAVMHNSSLDVHALVQQQAVQVFLNAMLGTDDRRSLYVVAVLSSVGWQGDAMLEGQAIAEHLELNWNEVRDEVETFNENFGIVPRGGRRRYISPVPLGIRLAIEAWDRYPDLLESLPNVLPTEAAKDAYYDRRRSIASTPSAKSFARGQLEAFLLIGDFLDAKQVKRWAALSAADPKRAARKALQALEQSTLEERLQVQGRARIELVSALTNLAWPTSTFADATKALALLAEAENASWSNNATGEFLDRFQLLGGTALPYLERLQLLDELTALGNPSITTLVIRALARAGGTLGIRPVSVPGELLAPEWWPSDESEVARCVGAAIERLTQLVERAADELEAVFVSAATDFEMSLLEDQLRRPLSQYFNAVRVRYPRARETLRRLVCCLIESDKKHWHQLSARGLSELQALHVEFEDPSFLAQLQQHAGPSRWSREEEPDYQQLAETLLTAPPALFSSAWSWLTSGEANDGWRFGETLGLADNDQALTGRAQKVEHRGQDSRVLCGYASKLRSIHGDGWFDQWFASLAHDLPRSSLLLAEVAWRCGMTPAIASQLEGLIRNGLLPVNVVEQLAFGKWVDDVGTSELEKLLKALTESGHGRAALTVLNRRLKAEREDAATWRGLVLELVCTPALICSNPDAQYYWHELAKLFTPYDPTRVAAAIVDAHSQRTGDSWRISQNKASTILLQCANLDPEGVWKVVYPHLSEKPGSLRFSLGFPKGIVELAPHDQVLSWVKESPVERATVLARVLSKDFSSDETLSSLIIDAYGHNQIVRESFLDAYCLGSWSGLRSTHWKQKASTLEDVLRRSRLPRLKQWARYAIEHLEHLAEVDRLREEEAGLPRR